MCMVCRSRVAMCACLVHANLRTIDRRTKILENVFPFYGKNGNVKFREFGL